MTDRIAKLLSETLSQFATATTVEELEQIQKSVLGKQGALQDILKGIKDLSDDQKKLVGPAANAAKEQILAAYQDRLDHVMTASIDQGIAQDHFDTSLPGYMQRPLMLEGGISPFAQFMRQSVEVFQKLGFTVWDGPHIVDDYENFEALNFKHDHPARDMQDTFYVEDGYVLRTHTSSMQHQILKESTFPIRAIVPGKCFRHEATDATHEVIFTQLEGIVVDKHISVSHLVGVLRHFLQEVLGEHVETRIRPGYFPFVEPGLELEVNKHTIFGGNADLPPKWVEVMPCGMIHPNVLRNAGIDTTEYSGFAFGFGILRLAQLKFGIDDCRLMFSEDARFLRQFSSL